MATLTFRKRKNNNEAESSLESFFRLNFDVYLDVDNKARARAKDKQRKPISLEEKREIFIGAVRKWEMLEATKGKMRSSKKKSEKEHSYIYSIKRVIGKFLEVSRCSHAKQRHRNVQKNVPHVQSTNNSYFIRL